MIRERGCEKKGEKFESKERFLKLWAKRGGKGWREDFGSNKNSSIFNGGLGKVHSESWHVTPSLHFASSERGRR